MLHKGKESVEKAGSTGDEKEGECTRMQRNQWRTHGVRGVKTPEPKKIVVEK